MSINILIFSCYLMTTSESFSLSIVQHLIGEKNMELTDESSFKSVRYNAKKQE